MTNATLQTSAESVPIQSSKAKSLAAVLFFVGLIFGSVLCFALTIVYQKRFHRQHVDLPYFELRSKSYVLEPDVTCATDSTMFAANSQIGQNGVTSPLLPTSYTKGLDASGNVLSRDKMTYQAPTLSMHAVNVPDAHESSSLNSTSDHRREAASNLVTKQQKLSLNRPHHFKNTTSSFTVDHLEVEHGGLKIENSDMGLLMDD